jgi:[acyl-carrier-protein] S-malonyltransferase
MLTAWLEDAELNNLLTSYSSAINLDLERLGTVADADEIKDTANAQPLIVAASLLSAHALGSDVNVSLVAGHSVGEIAAAALAGTMTEIDAMKLVHLRGQEMAKAASIAPAGMAAVLGGERSVVLAAISELGLVAANDNGAGQIVAAGNLEALSQ